ncbi:MAG: flagellar export chaperone FliS [bacterium]
MSYSNNAGAYRHREIQSASPARLVVLVFDQALANLMRARRAVQTGQIEERANAVGKTREAITELLVTLDAERGGEIAMNLQALYVYILSELIDVVRRPDGGEIERIIGIVTDLRGAFDSVASNMARVPAA